ncbi:hypothetical protein [Burkholderia thailandensis]|uniref:Uncharacterized protein n=1 Tax=Burkholderia thailandensis (strain ATCC 700388 / DSM 13276 / CCUG 48851 / CIP 106301 / E264) TaxID=271848 RepID=Q2T5B4_BURTA|nr:hypothetical protein [Burkholderia thailandensis]ABC34242.1 hypothetical protein BTH_II1439 [Burkholderia thailandensis E264]MBS2130908.1 hypothetical protein [Burkholderia thailandensis]MCS3399299.1 hypothetical protein [Burkholderia thailandensis]MCS6470628.1 hypothetical protein [Burkholderia thailandensis]MCS6477728.1 hypothetical protein [Burkholderia thailandensis]
MTIAVTRQWADAVPGRRAGARVPHRIDRRALAMIAGSKRAAHFNRLASIAHA